MNLPFDASIPVLTEVLQGEETPAFVAPLRDNGAAPAPYFPAPDSPPPHSPPPRSPALDWTALEARLAERILQQLQGSIEIALEQRLAAILQQSLSGLSEQLRHGLYQTMEKSVASAVSAAVREHRNVTPE